ncbi:MAG: YeeE/YedE family protein [Thermostichales cyanobacterium BF4_bins_65]
MTLPPPHYRVGMGILVLMVLLGAQVSWRQGILFLIGCGFGLTLYHARFGFAAAYRRWFLQGEVDGVLAQVLMLGVATLLFAPLLLTGQGQGAVAPVGIAGLIGAFLFGIGMQLGSGCACGTLYAIGGGSSLMLITLVAFCAGSFAASLLDPWWWQLPYLPPHALIQDWGIPGLLLQVGVLVGIGLWLGRRRGGGGLKLWAGHWLRGPWSLGLGALLLALLNTLTLWLAGRPWGVTWGFTLWAAKLAQLWGWDPAASPAWNQGFAAQALASPLWTDVTSVMNLGVVLGAAWAAAWAGHGGLRPPGSLGAVGGAVGGGILMGVGARMAFGCNVGAYFAGIASTSWHGWSWIAMALLGTKIGIHLRSRLGLPL